MPKTSELLLHDFISSVVDPAIILLDNLGNIMTWNIGAERLKGYSAEEIIGRHFSCFYTEEDNQSDKPQRVLTEARANGQFVDTGWRVRKDKTRFLAHTTITPLIDIHGNLFGFAKSTRDITQQKAFEDALTKSVQDEQVYRLLLKSVIDYAIIVLDPDGRVLTWNEGAQRIQGYQAEQIVGRDFSCFYPRGAVEAGKPKLELERARADGRFEVTGLRVRRNGIYYFAEVTITPLRNDARTITGFAQISRDITERKTIENALIQSQEKLQAMNLDLSQARDQAQDASKSKSDFVANISHEIRTPMNGIIGMCNVLLSTQLDASQMHYAGSIKQACNSLLTVINDVLDFSKIEAGQIEIEKIEFDPVSIIESVCEILAPLARQKQLSLMSFISPAVPKSLIGDGEKLRQIILNLASNAIKFTSKGEIVVKVGIDSRIENIVNLRFSVIDHGIGISEEDQLKLFQPFIQADGAITAIYGGTGLGLSISRHLTELMGGTIGVTSVREEGSTFWLTVPFIHSSEDGLDAGAELAGIHILIVDDEPYAREILQTYAHFWQMKADTAIDADSGLELMREAARVGHAYEIAVIDLSMPEKNGMVMATEILTEKALQQTQLILLTAFDTPGLGAQAIELGFKGYITKPVRQAQIQDCLLEVLSGRRTVLPKTASFNPLGDVSKQKRRKESILVVEDHELNQQVARLYLDAMGFECQIASDGVEAIKVVREKQFDIILMDCQMPRMNGFDATRLIREHETNCSQRTAIIAMTASALQGDRDKCLAAGMNDYLSKPIEVASLQRIIEKWLPLKVSSAAVDNTLEQNRSVRGALDYERLEQHYHGYVVNLIAMFIDSVPAQLEKLRQAVGEKNQISLLAAAHGLKGLCLTVFAPPMGEICADIELAGQNCNWPALDILTKSLCVEFIKVRDCAAEHEV